MKNKVKGDSPSLHLSNETSLYEGRIKRMLGLFFALIFLIFLLPLLLVVAVLIKLESPGPVFFIQERLGQHGRRFHIYKFRTMNQDAIKYQRVGVEITGEDERITFLGRFLRRFKIDELPQLVNILKGDMAWVGPRPTLPEYFDQYGSWELQRFKVKPGLTGLAQINGNIYLERTQRSSYDVKYVKTVTFTTDLKIIIRTMSIILLGEKRFIRRPSGDDIETEGENS